MTNHYKPLIAHQGCLIVTPEGKLYSPLSQGVNGLDCFMLLTLDEMDETGVKAAVKKSRQRLTHNYVSAFAKHLSFDANQLNASLKYEKMQEMGLLPINNELPDLKEIRQSKGPLLAGIFVNYWADGRMNEAQIKAFCEKNDAIRYVDKEESKPYMTISAKKFGAGITEEDEQKLLDSYCLGADEFEKTTRSLLMKRLDTIEQHPKEFLTDCKKQMPQFHGWKQRAARFTNWLTHNKNKVLIGSTGGAVAGAIPLIAANLTGGIGEIYVYTGAAVSYAGSSGIICATFANTLNTRMQRQLTYSTPYSQKTREKLSAQLDNTIGLLPKRMQFFLKHYEPTFFITDSDQHIKGKYNGVFDKKDGGEKGDTSLGTMFNGKNIIFIRFDNASNYDTVFEECAHLIHDHILNKEQLAAFTPAYEADLSNKKSREFFKKHSAKGIIEEYSSVYKKEYKVNFGYEVIQELCLIEDRLTRQGLSPSQASKEIIKNLPQMGKLYANYAALEDKEYQRLRKGGQKEEALEETTEHRERLHEPKRGKGRSRT